MVLWIVFVYAMYMCVCVFCLFFCLSHDVDKNSTVQAALLGLCFFLACWAWQAISEADRLSVFAMRTEERQGKACVVQPVFLTHVIPATVRSETDQMGKQ